MKFLSQEWINVVAEKVAAGDPLAPGVNVKIQQVVTDVPESDDEIKHYLSVVDGKPEVGLGSIEDPDATLTATYETSANINQGKLSVMAALGTGKLKIRGNAGAVMQNQAALMRLTSAFDSMRDQSTY